jgi:acetolactate synthase I/III small subunit
MKDLKNTIVIFSENKPGVLYRVADVFLKRKINIENLHVSETDTKGISKFKIVINQSQKNTQKTIDQLNKIIEVTRAFIDNA